MGYRAAPPNVDLTTAPGRHGRSRLRSPWRVVSRIRRPSPRDRPWNDNGPPVAKQEGREIEWFVRNRSNPSQAT